MKTPLETGLKFISESKPVEKLDRVKGNIDEFVRELRKQGLTEKNATNIATIIDTGARNSVSRRDWAMLEADRFCLKTHQSVEKSNIDVSKVMDAKGQAERYAAVVIENEGIPNGNGGTLRVRDKVVSGQYDNQNHGIDLVAAKQDGTPIIIEIKDYHQPSSAKLSDDSLTGAHDPFEPEVEQLMKTRKEAIYQDHSCLDQPSEVKQMNDLWVRDRWLKLIKNEEGRARLRTAGVDERYLNPQIMDNMDSLEWQKVMDNLTIGLVCDRSGNPGRVLVSQVLFEKRGKNIFTIYINNSSVERLKDN